MNAKKIIVPGIVAGIVILVLSMAIGTITQSLFNYNVLALEGMRSVNDPVMALFFVFPWVIGFALAILYAFARKSFSGNSTENGIALGILGWIVYGIPSAFMVYSSMNYPIGFTVNSIIGPPIYLAAAGIAIAKLSN